MKMKKMISMRVLNDTTIMVIIMAFAKVMKKEKDQEKAAEEEGNLGGSLLQ